MLGRKQYTQEELDNARATIGRQLAAYRKLVKAAEGCLDPSIAAALSEFEPRFAANMTLVLDRFFVHRLRSVTGKDGNPLNEVELLAEALLNGGQLRGNNVIKLVPEQSVLGLSPGDQVHLSACDFERLSTAFLEEIDERFVS
jgi:hypothetical protein